MGERGSQLLSDLEVTTGKAQALTSKLKEQRRSQWKPLSGLCKKLATTNVDLREVIKSLRVQLAELQNHQKDIGYRIPRGGG